VKRRDMINEITLYLDNQDIMDLDYLYTTDLAKGILKVIEEKGMMPPRTYLKALNTYDNGWDDE
jgi:hypothetical protein